jgi:trehalose synthase
VGAIEVNAFQSQADVVIQKSIREGFGLTVTEALWKARPILISSAEEAARRCVEVLSDPELGKRLGRAGKEHARASFLMPRLVRDWLEIFGGLQVVTPLPRAEAAQEGA